jgi:hypothetical protein
MKKYVTRAWKGEERLWKVFWLYNILYMYILAQLSNFLLAVGASGEKNGFNNTKVFVLISSLVFIIYMIWAVCSLWKCAFNVERKWWGYIVRTYVVLFVLGLLLVTTQLLR